MPLRLADDLVGERKRLAVAALLLLPAPVASHLDALALSALVAALLTALALFELRTSGAPTPRASLRALRKVPRRDDQGAHWGDAPMWGSARGARVPP